MKKNAIADAVEVMGEEQAAEAANLAAMVNESQPDAPVTVTGEPEPPPPPMPRMSAEESLTGLLVAASAVMGAAGLKSTAALWSEQTCAGCAGVVVPVLRKYPWGAGVLGFLETGAGSEEIALALFVLPVGFATAKAWRADAAAIKAARERVTEAAPADGGDGADE